MSVSLFAVSDRLKLSIMCEWHELNIRGAKGLDKSWPLSCCLREYNYCGSVQRDVYTNSRWQIRFWVHWCQELLRRFNSPDCTLCIQGFDCTVIMYADHISDGVSGVEMTSCSCESQRSCLGPHDQAQRNSAVNAPLTAWRGLTFPLSTRVQGDPDLLTERSGDVWVCLCAAETDLSWMGMYALLRDVWSCKCLN